MRNIFLQVLRRWSRRLVPDLFLFFEKDLNEVQVLIYFASLQRGHTKKTSCMNVQTWSKDMFGFGFWASGASISITFFVWFFKKSISHVMYYKPAKFHCLINSTSRDIRKYVYCYYLLPSFAFVNFKIKINLFIKPCSHIIQNVRTEI